MDGTPNPQPLLTYPQFQHVLRIEFARARRYRIPLACVVAQVDRIDRVREAHGPKGRDELLGRVVRRIQTQLRLPDSLALFQERFVLLLPHTDLAGAQAAASRLRVAVANEPFAVAGQEFRVTLAVGVAAYADRATIFFDSILKAAEAALSQAIAKGGDAIETASAGAGPARG